MSASPSGQVRPGAAVEPLVAEGRDLHPAAGRGARGAEVQRAPAPGVPEDGGQRGVPGERVRAGARQDQRASVIGPILPTAPTELPEARNPSARPAADPLCSAAWRSRPSAQCRPRDDPSSRSGSPPSWPRPARSCARPRPGTLGRRPGRGAPAAVTSSTCRRWPRCRRSTRKLAAGWVPPSSLSQLRDIAGWVFAQARNCVASCRSGMSLPTSERSRSLLQVARRPIVQPPSRPAAGPGRRPAWRSPSCRPPRRSTSAPAASGRARRRRAPW